MSNNKFRPTYSGALLLTIRDEGQSVFHNLWRCDQCNLFFSMKTFEKIKDKDGYADYGVCPHCRLSYYKEEAK